MSAIRNSTMTPAEVEQFIVQLPDMLAGDIQDPTGIVRLAQMDLAFFLFTEMKLAFVAKARGGTDKAGIKWAPLKPATIRRRRKKGVGGVEILRDTGRLLNSISPSAPGVTPVDGILEITPGMIRVGSNVVYASFHNEGGSIPGRPPQRQFIWESDGIPQDVLDRGVEKFRDRILSALQARLAS